MQRAVTWHTGLPAHAWADTEGAIERLQHAATRRTKRGAPKSVVCVVSEAQDLWKVGVVVEEESQHPSQGCRWGEEEEGGGPEDGG